MVEPGCPGVSAWGEVAVDGAEVVRLAEVVPGEQLHNVDLVAVRNDRLPAPGVQLVVAVVYELCPGG